MSKEKHHHKTHHLLLHFGPWIEDLPEDEVLVLISVALNYCVLHEEIKIKGYLITRSHLCLVIKSHKHSIHHILTVLSEQIASGVYAYLKLMYEEDDEEKVIYLHDQYSMFTKHTLQNRYLIQLITGKDVKLPYYSPKLARLKSLTHNYNYCSVPDYTGAKGPVTVYIPEKKSHGL
ncbi:MAG: hypothetical protein ACI9Y7_001328 [Dokdonia sp.]|jgi:hypothetical protein